MEANSTTAHIDKRKGRTIDRPSYKAEAEAKDRIIGDLQRKVEKLEEELLEVQTKPDPNAEMTNELYHTRRENNLLKNTMDAMDEITSSLKAENEKLKAALAAMLPLVKL